MHQKLRADGLIVDCETGRILLKVLHADGVKLRLSHRLARRTNLLDQIIYGISMDMTRSTMSICNSWCHRSVQQEDSLFESCFI